MLHPRFWILSAVPLAVLCAPAPAEDMPRPAAPLPPNILYTPAEDAVVPLQPANPPYGPGNLLISPAPLPAGTGFPMTVLQVDPKGFPIVASQGMPGYYPMPLIPAPGGVMAPAPTTVPYADLQFTAPNGAPVLIIPTKPPAPSK